MNCSQAEDRFSEFHEGSLQAAETQRLEAHLADCEACRRNFESFRYALGDLQALEVRETSETEVASILAAVDLATQDTPAARPTGRIHPFVSHLVAAGIGALLIWFFWPREIAGEQVVVEREVPVETVVEKLVEVEVPVEVVREVPVEVERIVEVEVERFVAHPLQANADRLLAFSESVVELALLAEGEREQNLAVETEVDEPSESLFVSREELRSPVRVVRSEEDVSIRTRGSTSEVVPVLIGMLTDPDSRVRTVVQQRLEEIRGVAGTPGAEVEPPTRTPVGIANLRALIHGTKPAAEPVDESPEAQIERWREWWASESTNLAAADPRITY